MTDGEPRGAPVTVEEMTRRRDGWRQRWDEARREAAVVRYKLKLAEEQVERYERRVVEAVREESVQRSRADAAEADAHRRALEAGGLRVELADTVRALITYAPGRVADMLEQRADLAEAGLGEGGPVDPLTGAFLRDTARMLRDHFGVEADDDGEG